MTAIEPLIGSLRFKSGCRCFIGKSINGGRWQWTESNAVAFEGFLEALLKGRDQGMVEFFGEPENFLIVQKTSTILYRAKYFIGDVRKTADPWDKDFLRAA
jgi:hypothetical protein